MAGVNPDGVTIIGLIAFIGICQAVEHAYSSQSITRYDSHHEHEQGKHEEPAYEEYKHEDYKYEDYGDNENKYGQKNEHKVDHKFEHKVDHKVEHKVDHKVEHKVSPKIQDEHQFEDYGHIFNNFDDKKHVEHEPEHEVEHKSEHKSEHKVEHIKEHNENNKEESYGHKENEHEVYIKTKPVFEKYEDHKFTAATPIKVVPIAQYVQKDSEDHHNEHHELATSSQHIARHDVPAPPPKGFSDHSGPAKYEFAYEVKDPKTGDHKYQHEARDGHTVKGIYSLHEADGSIRTVEYAADKHAGFSAAVKQTTKHIEEKHHR